ncbi:MAG: hypothetical protein ACI89L_001097 [Phycisphaerales bacterium]|jgi:hypothetical protein
MSMVGIFSSACLAQSGIYVEFWNQPAGGGWDPVEGFPDSSFEAGWPSGSNITINDSGGLTYRVFAVSQSTTDIGTVTVSGSSSLTPKLIIGSRSSFSTNPPVLQRFVPSDFPGCRNFGGIVELGVDLTAQVDITGNLTGDIDVHELIRVEATGSIGGSLFHNRSGDSGAGAMGPIIGSSITAASIRSFKGNIDEVRATSGSITSAIRADAGDIVLVKTEGANATITGAITTNSGRILAIRSTGSNSKFLGSITADPGTGSDGLKELEMTGDIGTPTSAVQIQSGGSITKIVGSSIYADIDAIKFDAEGSLAELHTTGGDFVGSLKVNRFTSSLPNAGITLAGDFNGRLEIIENAATGIGGSQTNPFTFDILAGGSFIAIDRGISEDWILEANGLKGNVVVNADNNSSGASGFAPNDEIILGTGPSQIILNQLNYTISSTQLGGGAVGAPPFKFHPVDCEPDHDPDGSSPLPAIPTEIILEYYGPIVEKNSAGPKPYIVEWADWTASDCGGTVDCSDTSCNASGVWTNVTNDWDYAMHPADTLHPGGNTRRIKLNGVGTGGSFAFGQSISAFSVPLNVVYRVRFRPQGAANTLLCDVNADQTPYDRVPADEPVVVRPGAGGGKVWQCDEGNYKFFVGGVQTLTTLDLDADGVIGTGDVLQFGNTPSDVNRDGSIDTHDLLLLVEAQGEPVDG